MRGKLKGIEFTTSTIIKIVIASIVVVVSLHLFLSRFYGLIWIPYTQRDINSDCISWASQHTPFDKDSYNKENYPALYDKFGNNYISAKNYCETLKVKEKG